MKLLHLAKSFLPTKIINGLFLATKKEQARKERRFGGFL
jgi:hypothetical protein